MAADKGFFKKAGIELQIKNGGPGIVNLREVASGESDFATGWLISALRLRAKGMKLVLIGQFFQKSALTLMVKKTSGIHSVNDFSGHTMGVWPGDFQIPPKALIRKLGIRNVKVVNQAFDMEPFLKGEIEIASAMRYNEYYQVLEAGLKPEDLIVFKYSDIGMNLPEDGIYVKENFAANHPEECKKFIRASIKGWRYAFSHKDETVKLMTELANRTDFKTDEKRQLAMLNEIEKLIDFENIDLRKEDFHTALNELKATKIIRKDIPYDTFTKIQ